ncbi:hypothetical protein FRX31_025265 [Thalictrum thalictroides]|uniref:Uncharacterized protein n=1 Tax=Thalictrum thalictroides TaxID=46969 RepID=A0A7J6VKK9_THATH|nr:hypothetical protein FRX31_025265 [Thalictrum thalictroides]
MQDLSEQNRENRREQKLPNCSGRTTAQVVRYRIAQELGIDPSEVGRGYTFLAMHTHPDKTPQNVQISAAIQSSMSSNPDSQTTCCDDAVTEVLGPDSRGRLRVGGAGICKTQMKKTANIKKNKHMKQGRTKNGRLQLKANWLKLQVL